jgi:putative ABC transport system ATP-binding protein
MGHEPAAHAAGPERGPGKYDQVSVRVFGNGAVVTYRNMPSSDRKKRVNEALERVAMSHRSKHYPSQLSGGQQQRVAVARALGGDPLILLADEPTGNLDSQNGEAVITLLRELHRSGATICMVTHDPRYARHADRSIHLFDGRVVDQPVEEVVV